MPKFFPAHLPRVPRAYPIILVVLVAPLVWYFRHVLYTAWTLLLLPIGWSRGSSDFVISRAADGFDVTFADYGILDTSAGPDHSDRVPPVLHHIMLGPASARDTWTDARRSCIDLHPGWEARMWTDENAEKLVAEKFPGFKETWDSYGLQIQKVDALRYLVLYEYGGVVLDMDLKCRRSLGPLRRFDFVAPAAHPTGFSISFMMSSRHNEFMGKVVEKLKVYNWNWFWLPYPTVMFSTGGHFSSTIHMLQRNRTEYKVLAGPEGDRGMHSLNGKVATPLFEHLGSSSWHSYDSSLIVLLGESSWMLPLLIVVSGCILIFVGGRYGRRVLARLRKSTVDPDLEKREA